jgi:hypothetical protein
MKKRIMSAILAFSMILALLPQAMAQTPQIQSVVTDRATYNLGNMVRATIFVDPGIRSWQVFWIRNGEITTQRATVRTTGHLSDTVEIGTVNSVEYDGIAIFAYTEQFTTETIPSNHTSGNPIVEAAYFTVHHSEEVLTTFTDSLSTSDSVNTHTFTLSQPGRVWFSFSRPDLGSSTPGWNVSLRNADGTSLLSITANGNTTNDDSFNNYLPAGTHNFQVTSRNAWAGGVIGTNYTLTVNYTLNTGQFEIESNNSAATATRLSVNSPITGNLYSSEDVDYFTFSIAEPGRVSLNFRRPNIGSSTPGWNVSLRDVDGTVLLDIIANGNSANDDSINNYLAAGTYRVRISARNAWAGGVIGTDYNSYRQLHSKHGAI